ncbi:hypothetical protein DVH24_036591 [Malus domestica]|uniref:Small ribosomal subunit protein uS15c n=1 Tax=Malus domestica TaxID=3750 RepID=A0A498IGD8_MALDO|nr:hypothetical protein DVH24_036591 [Malus domestica]
MVPVVIRNSEDSPYVISQEEKDENRGSVKFQIDMKTYFTFTITQKNYLSQRGLRKILGKRQRLLSYLSKKNRICYKELINRLDIRESKTR